MDILDQILARKRQEVIEAQTLRPIALLQERAQSQAVARDFTGALKREGMQVIAEVKKASPSAGIIRADFDPVKIAMQYQNGGAAALSVLTDKDFFQGDPVYLTNAKNATNLPVLRKDFIIDEYQLWEARVMGADAVLLIAEALPDARLRALYELARSIGLHVLVELHDADQLPRVLDCGATVIGINNRDLRTFKTDLMHTIHLMKDTPKDRVVISESGIRTHQDLLMLQEAGVSGVLVGESLMKQENPESALLTLRGQAS